MNNSMQANLLSDRDVSLVFQTLPERKLTAYYKIILRPMSLFMIKVRTYFPT